MSALFKPRKKAAGRTTAGAEASHLATQPPTHSHNPIVNLQRTIGNQAVLRLTGSKDQKGAVLGSYLPLSGPFAAFAGAPVTPVAGLARNHQALAQARNGAIEMDASMMRAPASEVQSLLAHEAVHLAQQEGKGHAASPGALEAEASLLSRTVIAGGAVRPMLSGHSGTALKQPPGKEKEPTQEELRELDKAYKAAKSGPNLKLDHLRAQLEYLKQLRKLIRERQALELRRTLLDAADFGNVNQSGFEGAAIDLGNRRPLNIHVIPPYEGTRGEIDFSVRFHVRFVGRKAAEARGDFEKLRSNLEAGISKVWGQNLGALPSLVHNYDFSVTPTVVLVDDNAPRDPDFWLIEVDPGIKRAQTLAMVNSGVMSIAPKDLDSADTLGHESLHLFGLIDRYRDNPQTGHSESIRGTGKPGTGSGVTKKDPLDTGKGPILPEDLEFVFAHAGAYEQVILANLTDYHVALLRRKGWGHVPRLVDLLKQADDESTRAQEAAKSAPPAGKAGQRASAVQIDPQKIILKLIDERVAQVTAEIDQEVSRAELTNLPDMAKPEPKRAP